VATAWFAASNYGGAHMQRSANEHYYMQSGEWSLIGQVSAVACARGTFAEIFFNVAVNAFELLLAEIFE
jgi:hypothetical protein